MSSDRPISAPAGTVRAVSALLCAGAALGGLGQALAGSAAVLLAARIAGDSWSGVPQTALVLGAGAGSGLIGWLAPRLGRARALAFALAVAVCGGLLVIGAAQYASLGLLLGGCLAIGAGNAAVLLSRYAAADAAAPDHRARAMATVLAVTTVGSVAGPNLLNVTGALGRAAGLAEFAGQYVTATVVFVVAVVLLRAYGARVRARTAFGVAPEGPGPDRTPWSRANLAGLLVLAVANVVMFSAMTMASVELRHGGAGLTLIGAVVSLHTAGMFAPSPLSGRLVDRWGAEPTAAIAGLVLAAACGLGGAVADNTGTAPRVAFTIAMVGLGVGWNLALVAGSSLLTRSVAPVRRPRRESTGDMAMAATAAVGGAGSGLIMAATSYSWLASICLVVSLALPAAVLAARGSHQHASGGLAAGRTRSPDQGGST